MADCKYKIKEKVRQLWRKIGIEEEAIEVADAMSRGNTDLLKNPTDTVKLMFFQFGRINAPIRYMASEFSVTSKSLSKYFNEDDSKIRESFESGLMMVHSGCMGAMMNAISNGDWRAADSMLNRLDNARIRMDPNEEQQTAQLELKLPENFINEYLK